VLPAQAGVTTAEHAPSSPVPFFETQDSLGRAGHPGRPDLPALAGEAQPARPPSRREASAGPAPGVPCRDLLRGSLCPFARPELGTEVPARLGDVLVPSASAAGYDLDQLGRPARRPPGGRRHPAALGCLVIQRTGTLAYLRCCPCIRRHAHAMQRPSRYRTLPQSGQPSSVSMTGIIPRNGRVTLKWPHLLL
jgi:hypothetical protein